MHGACRCFPACLLRRMARPAVDRLACAAPSQCRDREAGESRMRRLPPLTAIEAFVQVARLGSVKAAAEALALSSPALSRRVQAMERFVGRSAVRAPPSGDGAQRRWRDAAVADRAAARCACRGDRAGHRRGRDHAAEARRPAALRLAPADPSPARSSRPPPATAHRHRHRTRMPSRGSARGSMQRSCWRQRSNRRSTAAGSAATESSRSATAIWSRVPPPSQSPADLAGATILLHRDMPDNFTLWREAVGLPRLEPRRSTCSIRAS